MAALDLESPLGRHFEKIVVLAAILLMVAMVAVFVVMRSPLKGRHEAIRDRIDDVNAKRNQVVLDNVLNEAEKADLGLTGEPLTVDRFRMQLAAAGQPWPESKDPIAGLTEKVTDDGPPPPPHHPPERVLPVEELQVASGRGVTKDEVPRAVAAQAEKGIFDIVWAGVAGKFDLTEQLRLNAEGESQMPIILLTEVAVQRRERRGDGWSDWQPVPRSMPVSIAGKLPTGLPADPRDTKAVGAWYASLQKMQLEVRRPPFYELASWEGDTAADVSQAVEGVLQPSPLPRAAQAPAAGPAMTPPPAAMAAPTPTMPPAPPGWVPPGFETEAPTAPETPFAVEPEHVYATVWAHDVTVAPGKTYQYRMRVSIFNPVYGDPDVKKAEERWALQVPGEWSRPSPPVTVPSLVDFYFVGSFGNRANLELHRWIHGQWVIVPSVPITIGAPVFYQRRNAAINLPGRLGTVQVTVDFDPGVVLVDLVPRFDYRPPGSTAPTRTSVLVISDRQGDLGRRIMWEDVNAAANAKQERTGG